MEEKDLKRKMRQYKIFEKDIKEEFILASGPGGQNVNKVATCVSLVHLPTGVRVKCQRYRTQGQNRDKARVMLVDKIEKMLHKETMDLKSIKALKMRQNRKRPISLKEEILKDKHHKSEKKAQRKKINPKDADGLD